mmetsp:Transcript_15119/g.29832  ORF Transcript_15119/g.29832 Transcript_15119/m.29832 type:complete len:237 (+) Transcript_15119:468-1178(+)
MIRDPEHPVGCPMAMAPPSRLVMVRSMPRAFSHARYCAAKASLTSMMSMSLSVSPAHASVFSIAGTGPYPMMEGSTPADAQATMRERGLRLCFLQASSLARMSDPAPSEMPEALPADTRPSFLNMLGSFARLSIVAAPPRGCSSTEKVVVPFLVTISTGVISCAKRPSSWAFCQLCCDRRAYSSHSTLLIPIFSPTFSAVRAMGILMCWSLSADHSVSSSTRLLGNLVPLRTSLSA